MKRIVLVAGALLIGLLCVRIALHAQDSEPLLAPTGISAANWYWGPANRWSWHNTRRIFPNARVGRADGPSAVPLGHEEHDVSHISFIDPVTKHSMTVAEMLDATFTDGFIVLHHGRIVAESYRNGMTANDPHLLMSVSKSVMGVLAGILVGRKQFDPHRLVTDYIPELKGTVYEGATIRNLLDMSVADPVESDTPQGPTKDQYKDIDEAAGWLPGSPTSAPGFRAYLTGLRQPHGVNGEHFLYLDASAIIAGLAMDRATGEELSTLLTEHLWSKLGTEQDAYLLLDRQQQAFASAGFNATLRDLARFGQMMAQGGRYNGQQIVPESWVADIRSNGRSETKTGMEKLDVGLAAPAPLPGHERGTYRSFWWITEQTCGRFAGLGLGGQMLIVDPIADIVVVKFDSSPTPEAEESASRTQYKGIDALIKALSGYGCSKETLQ